MEEAAKIIKIALIFLSIYCFDYGLGFHVVPRMRNVGIIGGEVATAEEFPYMVSIWKKGNLHCGGTIVDQRFVLSAGHCFKMMETYPYYVLAGTIDTEEGGQKYYIEEIRRHEEFTNNGENDICLLKLTEPIAYSSRVFAATLSKDDANYAVNTTFTVAGWGSQEVNGPISEVLRKTSVRLFDQNTCKDIYQGKTRVDDTMLCAGSKGHDACVGDSGGPLILGGLVVGIVSRGLSCGGEQPTIYTKVSEYSDWIEVNMEN